MLWKNDDSLGIAKTLHRFILIWLIFLNFGVVFSGSNKNSHLLKEVLALYNKIMIKKKYIHNLNKHCLSILTLFIVSGCALPTKKDQVIGIQKVRIQKLEQQLENKNKVIAELKVQKWVKKPVKVDEALALKPLQRKIQKKQWIKALRLSSALKKQYPHSIELKKYRVMIFKKMGLNKQASREMSSLRRAMIQQKRSNKKLR